jgi:hypothetical protein
MRAAMRRCDDATETVDGWERWALRSDGWDPTLAVLDLDRRGCRPLYGGWSRKRIYVTCRESTLSRMGLAIV